MAYYIIGSGPEFPFLGDAIRIEDKKKLADVIASPGDDPFFFVQFSESSAHINDLVLMDIYNVWRMGCENNLR